jgi:hypothetical protein
MTGASYEIKLSGVQGIETIAHRLIPVTLSETGWDRVLSKMWFQVRECLGDRSNETVRLKAAEATVQLLELQGRGSQWREFREELKKVSTEERSSVVRQALGTEVDRFLRES